MKAVQLISIFTIFFSVFCSINAEQNLSENQKAELNVINFFFNKKLLQIITV